MVRLFSSKFGSHYAQSHPEKPLHMVNWLQNSGSRLPTALLEAQMQSIQLPLSSHAIASWALMPLSLATLVDSSVNNGYWTMRGKRFCNLSKNVEALAIRRTFTIILAYIVLYC